MSAHYVDVHIMHMYVYMSMHVLPCRIYIYIYACIFRLLETFEWYTAEFIISDFGLFF